MSTAAALLGTAHHATCFSEESGVLRRRQEATAHSLRRTTKLYKTGGATKHSLDKLHRIAICPPANSISDMRMTYWLNLFTGKTWREFQAAGAKTSGFREHVWTRSKGIKPGDVFL